jgi:CDP-diacylglycerol--serine O-phosphatidyltransferase
MRRAIVILPGAFTSGNLFFGIWAVIEASRGNFVHASWFIIVAAIMDVIDGRVARMSRTGTQFGAEMDSLVDAISFGVAPALLVYFHTFRAGEWAWLLSFIYVLAAVLRLARFNVEQAGKAKSSFFGLPSPAAGMTLASFHPFTLTPFFRENLSGLWNWPLTLAVLTVCLGLLMVSHVPYPVWPRIGLRNAKGIAGLVFTLATLLAAVTIPEYFFFPLCIVYIMFGILRAVMLGLFERLPERDPLRDEEEDEQRPIDDGLSVNPKALPFQIRKGRRRPGGQP